MPTNTLREEMLKLEQQMTAYEDSGNPTNDDDIREFLPRTIEALQTLYGVESKIEFRLFVKNSDILATQYQVQAVVTSLGALGVVVNEDDPESPTVLDPGPSKIETPAGDLKNRPGMAFKSLHDSLIKEIESKLRAARHNADVFQTFIEKSKQPLVHASLSSIFPVRDPDDDRDVPQ